MSRAGASAIVVGSGPNGLAAALELARAGVSVTVLEAAATIGGGTRTSELTVPGLLHDHCSAAHPMGVGSPFFVAAELERYGLRWCWPEVDLAHPLDDPAGPDAVAVYRSIEETAAGLGADGERWKRVFGAPSRSFSDLGEDLMGPLMHLPRRPLALARFGAPTLLPAALLARAFKTPAARALWGGVAAHSFRALGAPMSSAIGCALVCAAHAGGWPVAEGGSRAISDALAAALGAHGGVIETGVEVRDFSLLGDAEIVIFDLAPAAVAEIAAERLPARVARAYRRYRHGPGTFKVDLAVEGGVPWRSEAARRAGTVHLIGSLAELVQAENEVNRGRMPERPFVLLSQQYLADPSRSRGDLHPIWAYAHVPHGYDGDASEALIDQIERFAPGLRERIVARAERSPADLSSYNANYIGGDIATGANSARQLAFRPRMARDPYYTGIPGVYICSAATPPGAGVHGMCGFQAATRALGRLGS